MSPSTGADTSADTYSRTPPDVWTDLLADLTARLEHVEHLLRINPRKERDATR